jgi:hypothetical protein
MAIPATAVTDLLRDNWNAGNVTKPAIVEVNVPRNAVLRFDLTKGDIIAIRSDPSSYNVQYRCGYNYYDERCIVIGEIHTKESRKRLYDLVAEVQRICEANTHAVPGYQLIRFGNMTEFTTEELNIWEGNFNIFLESSGVRSAHTVP